MSRRRLWIAWLPDGKRLRLRDGPFDLILQAFGRPGDIAKAYDAAIAHMRESLETETAALRAGAAARMSAAVLDFAGAHGMTPNCVATGAAADAVLAAMQAGATLERAFVNNNGGIAFYLAEGQSLTTGAMGRPEQHDLPQKILLEWSCKARGIAMTGWAGKFPRLGIADAVFVTAGSAAMAEAAAKLIANATDLPGHPAIERVNANALEFGSELGEREVTVGVAPLQHADKAAALAAGTALASGLRAGGLIEDAALVVQGEISVLCQKPVTRSRILGHHAEHTAGYPR